MIPITRDPLAPRGGFTARLYIDVLEEALPDFIEELGGINKVVFMQDNSPIHKAHIITDWLREKKINVIVWPSYLPDLNPIENIWATLKRQIHLWYPQLDHMPGGPPRSKKQ